MNILEEIIQIFNISTPDASIALAIIVGGSFALGSLIFWLVFYLPLMFSSRRQIKVLSNDLEALQKTHIVIDEEHKVLSVRVENLEKDLAEAQQTIAEKTEENITVSNNLEIANSKLYQAQKYQNNAQEEYGELKKLYNLAQMSVNESERVAEIAKNGQRHLEAQLDQIKNQYASFDAEKRQYTEQIIQLRAELEDNKSLNLALQQELNALTIKINEQESLLAENLPKAAQFEDLQEELLLLRTEKSQVAAQLSTYTDKEEEERNLQQQEKNMMETYLHLVEDNMQDNAFFETLPEDSLIEDAALLAQNLEKLGQNIQTTEEIELLAIDTTLTAEEALDFAILEEKAMNAMNMPGFYQDIDPTALILSEEEVLNEERDEDQMIANMLKEVNIYLEQSPLFSDIPTEELIEDAVLLSQNLAQLDDNIQPIDFATFANVNLTDDEKYSMETALNFAKNALNTEGLYLDISREQLIDPNHTVRISTAAITIDAKYSTEIEKNVIIDLARINAQYTSDMPKDDLKQIDGIGSFIEQKLNHLSIYTFDQISKFDDTFISKLTAAIGFAEDAIHRDNWIEQARELCQQLS